MPLDFSLDQMIQQIHALPAMQAKRDIQTVSHLLVHDNDIHDLTSRYALPGDDCAAIASGAGYQLLAMEGMLPSFVQAAPWFAGWSAVMANVSDIAAMGGRATAIVNAFWHHDADEAFEIMRGIRDACRAYGLILAGGHSSMGAHVSANLAVGIMGYARKLLSTFHVEPDQCIAMAVDLNGLWHANTAYWKSFEGKADKVIRAQLEVIPKLTEAGQLLAAKDISNAGILGTLLMLLETTGCGAEIDLDALPSPEGVDLLRWLQIFPSYGFLFTLNKTDLPTVIDAFAAKGITCAAIGQTTIDGKVHLTHQGQRAPFWNLRTQPFTGFSYTAKPTLKPKEPHHARCQL